MRQKLKYIIERLKEGYIFFFAYLPVSMARYNLDMVISTQRSYENADETIILVRYLLSVAELILLEYSFAHELRADKIGRYISVGIRLTAGYAFIKAMLVLFFGIV